MTLRFVHISDTHIGTTPDYELYGQNTYAQTTALIEFINNKLPFEPTFVLHTGDVTYDPDPAATEEAAKLLSQLNYPLYVVRGNHDDPDALRAHFAHLPAGEGRVRYDFLQQDYHFIVLDTYGREQPAGYLEDDDLDFLEMKLHASTARSLVIVLHHIPTITGNDWLDKRMRIMNDARFFELLESYRKRIRGIFFGHIHDFSTHQVQGILCSSTAAAFSQFIYPDDAEEPFMVTTPGGFSLVTLRHEGPTTILHHLPGGK
jgi:3',5'-cyclic-AMP phosphodiesterase